MNAAPARSWAPPPHPGPTTEGPTIDDAAMPLGIALTPAEDPRAPARGVALKVRSTIGHGEGLDDVGLVDGAHALLPRTHVPRAPLLRAASRARARIPPETIQRVVRQSFGRFRVCYEGALRRNPSLEGRVAVKFAIDPSGAVSVASDGGSDLPDEAVIDCVVRGFASLTFPEFASGTVTVVYPLVFTPPRAR